MFYVLIPTLLFFLIFQITTYYITVFSAEAETRILSHHQTTRDYVDRNEEDEKTEQNKNTA